MENMTKSSEYVQIRLNVVTKTVVNMAKLAKYGIIWGNTVHYLFKGYSNERTPSNQGMLSLNHVLSSPC